MDTIKRQIVHETESDIGYKKTLIQRCEEAIQRLRSDKHPFSTVELVQKKKQELVRLKDEITVLEKKVVDIEQGVYDEELASQVSNTRADQIKKKQAAVAAKLAKNPMQPLRTASAPVPGVPYRRPDNDRYLEKRKLSDELYYFKQCEKFPDYLKKNLANMPNNEGYLWRDIWFMGSRPDRGTGTVLHERTRAGQFLMHEYKNGYHTVYEKNGRNKKLISKVPKPLLV